MGLGLFVSGFSTARGAGYCPFLLFAVRYASGRQRTDVPFLIVQSLSLHYPRHYWVLFVSSPKPPPPREAPLVKHRPPGSPALPVQFFYGPGGVFLPRGLKPVCTRLFHTSSFVTLAFFASWHVTVGSGRICRLKSLLVDDHTLFCFGRFIHGAG